MSKKRLLAVAALAALAPLTLAACGGGGSSSSSGGASSASVDSLTVLDYYSMNQDNQIGPDQARTTAAPRSGSPRSTTSRCPATTLIAKVLQQASSKTLPDVLMLDNPDIQQIAATGALAPLGDFGING